MKKLTSSLNEFADALCLRYDLSPSNLPSHCVCGKGFSVSHTFICPHGAFPILHHNDVRDLTDRLLCATTYVQIEPHLQPLSGKVLHYRSTVVEDDTTVDIRASGFWRCSHHKAFFDVRVFNCFAETNCSSALAATFCRHEGKKHCAYEERVSKVEHGSFTPLIFF